MKKPNAVIILDALLLGLEIELGGKSYKMMESIFGHPCLCQKGFKEYKLNGEWIKEDWWFSPYYSSDNMLEGFLELCSHATEYEIDVICANIVLNRLHRKD